MTVTGSRPSGPGAPAVPDSFTITGGSVDISSQDLLDQELVIDAVTVEVTAQSSFGARLSGVSVQLAGSGSGVTLYGSGTFIGSATSTGTTDANGVVSLLVLRNLAYTTKATPAAGSGYLVTNLGLSPVVTEDTGWTITLDRELHRFEGTVRDRAGMPVTDATVRLDGAE